MNNKKNILLFILVSTIANLFSQGLVENELTTNAVLIQKRNELSTRGTLRSGSITDTIAFGTKGILDDFSYDSPYPDTSIWLDNSVFINRDFPKAPITIGVATFDGLNANGYPYNFQAGSGSSGPADTLTSKPIDLSYTPADSIYLSFYYQPQGLGNAPEATDSLVLQFREAGTFTNWKNVWAHKGQSLATNDSSWTLVMIPIKDVNYLKKGFQFRFKNYATLSGNVDHWSIDYVYINKNRRHYEKQFDDIAYVYNVRSILKNYSKMPWKHYSQNELVDSVPNWIRNNFVGVPYIPVSYGNVVINETSSTIIGNVSAGSSFNVRPFDSTYTYTGCDISTGCLRKGPTHKTSFPPTNFLTPTKISFKQYVYQNGAGGLDFNPQNDTLTVHQNFDNDYAYDDGTAETSFGMSTLYGKLAEKFVITTPDTLQAIDIYWNPVLTDVSQLYTFNLMVWADNGGQPGIPIFTDSTAKPMYNATGYDKFTRHYLQKTKVYLPAGTYYFGFNQNTNQFLNIGVDRNSNTQNKVFYNVTGTWNNSPFPGSLMLHPVFGASSEFVGIPDRPVLKTNSITVFPNPAKDQLFIKGLTNNNESVTVSIIDLFGRTLKQEVAPSIESIDVSDLANGMYVLKISSENFMHTNKFVVSR